MFKIYFYSIEAFYTRNYQIKNNLYQMPFKLSDKKLRFKIQHIVSWATIFIKINLPLEIHSNQ